MGKITRKEFVEALTTNLSHFAGVTRTFDLNYFKSFFDEALPKAKTDGVLLEMRSCTARSKDLVFSGGSHLELSGREFYRVDGNCYTLYVCLQRWIDQWNNKDYIKSMLYIVM